MGYDNANAEKYLGFTSDILKKIAQTNLDMEEEKLKASLHFLKNPSQPVQVAYTGPDGKVVGPIAAMPIQTEFGIQYRLGRVDEQGNQIFDVYRFLQLQVFLRLGHWFLHFRRSVRRFSIGPHIFQDHNLHIEHRKYRPASHLSNYLLENYNL